MIGDPVSHSLSPFIMKRAFAECGVDATYSVRSTSPSDTAATIREMRSQGFAGVNETYPLKEIVL